MSNLAKQKVSFVFHSTKDLQKMPLGNLSFLHILFLKKRNANQQKQCYGMIFSMSKQVSPPKIAQSCKK